MLEVTHKCVFNLWVNAGKGKVLVEVLVGVLAGGSLPSLADSACRFGAA